MSIIGPRPPLTYHPWPIEEYSEEQLHMFDVRPGVTGWAQINGRDKVDVESKAQMDGYYVENMSLWLDIKILFITAKKVIKREGIFEGNSN
jgi:sugar transferase EpsL